MVSIGRKAAWSLGIAIGLNCLAVALSLFSSPLSSRSWAVLSLPASTVDAAALSSLEGAGFSSVICESSQWVLLNDFDVLEKVPLSQYSDRVEAFDPRNDGWALRLEALFVSGGQRRFFIPMQTQPLSLQGKRAESRIAALFPDIKHEFVIQGSSVPPLWALGIFLAAAVAVFFISGRSKAFLLALPAAFSLSLAGCAGFAAAAFLILSVGLAVPPVREWMRYRQGLYVPSSVWALVSLVLALGCALLAGLSVLCALLDLVATAAALFAAACAADFLARKRDHHRFVPLSLSSRSQPLLSRAKPCLPLGIASLIVLLGAGIPGISANSAVFPSFALPEISIGDYKAHVDFQKDFSRACMVHDSGIQPSYGSYALAADGLLDGRMKSSASVFDFSFELPPAERMLASSGEEKNALLTGANGSLSGQVLACLLISGCCLYVSFHLLRRRRRARMATAYSEKRIAA